jgi:hypothetical protein
MPPFGGLGFFANKYTSKYPVCQMEPGHNMLWLEKCLEKKERIKSMDSLAKDSIRFGSV